MLRRCVFRPACGWLVIHWYILSRYQIYFVIWKSWNILLVKNWNIFKIKNRSNVKFSGMGGVLAVLVPHSQSSLKKIPEFMKIFRLKYLIHNFNYNGDLNNWLVRYSGHGNLYDHWMVHYSDHHLNTGMVFRPPFKYGHAAVHFSDGSVIWRSIIQFPTVTFILLWE